MFDFVPILVNEDAYEGVLCLACKSRFAIGECRADGSKVNGKVFGERFG